MRKPKIMTIHDTWKSPVYMTKTIAKVGDIIDQNGKMVSITLGRLRTWVRNHNRKIENGETVPICLDHIQDMRNTIGYAVEMYIRGDELKSRLKFPDKKSADYTKIGDTSVMARKFSQSGKAKYVDCIQHVGLTPTPRITGLGGYELCCGLGDFSRKENSNMNEYLKEVVERFAEILGLEPPADALESDEGAKNWLIEMLDTLDEQAGDPDDTKGVEDALEGDDIVASLAVDLIRSAAPKMSLARARDAAKKFSAKGKKNPTDKLREVKEFCDILRCSLGGEGEGKRETGNQITDGGKGKISFPGFEEKARAAKARRNGGK